MSYLIDTFNKKNTKRPVWFMRQAGRYLPEYMKIRNSVGGFLELCYDPRRASEVTLQPIKRFDLDAAILFADILILPHILGWDVSFVEGKGPVLRAFGSERDFSRLSDRFSDRVNNIYETVGRVRSSLPRETSLIGFAGSPWTVVSYMLEGGAKKDFSTSKNFLYNKPDTAKKLIDLISDKTIEYLSGQIDAGADVIQLFDSWSGMLNGMQYDDFVVYPTKKIVSILKDRYPNVRIIGFPRGSGYNYEKYIKHVGVDGVGVDQFVPLPEMRKWQKNILVQGNLDPVVLLGSKKSIEFYAGEILSSLDNKNFIFNLGHGILPSTPVQNVKHLVNYVKQYNEQAL